MVNNLVVEMSGDLFNEKKEDILSQRSIAVHDLAARRPDLNIYMIVPSKFDLKFITSNKNIRITRSDDSIRSSLLIFRNLANAVYVSAGDTRWVSLKAQKIIGTIGGRMTLPILASTYPKINGHAVIADIGGLSLFPEENKMIWTTLAVRSMAESLYGQSEIGMINIGEEPGKGGDLEKIRIEMEKASGEKISNIEMSKLQNSTINAVVTSGFIGNSDIKTLEGAMKMLKGKVGKNFFLKSLFGILFYLCWQDLDLRKYSGAYMLGLLKPAIKLHGSAGQVEWNYALERAIDSKTSNIFEKVNNDIRIKKWIESQKLDITLLHKIK